MVAAAAPFIPPGILVHLHICAEPVYPRLDVLTSAPGQRASAVLAAATSVSAEPELKGPPQSRVALHAFMAGTAVLWFGGFRMSELLSDEPAALNLDTTALVALVSELCNATDDVLHALSRGSGPLAIQVGLFCLLSY